MTELWQRLKQRKLVQWALAYAAAAFALLQGVDIVAQRFGWPDAIERIFIVAICVGFVITLLLAWYHGEQARQRVTSTELLIITLVLGFGAVLLWRVAGTSPAASSSVTSAKPDGAIAAASSTPATHDSGGAIPAKSIAVLPFENLSEDKGNAYFADGMQDLILTRLADIGELKVISRTSTMKYASHPDDLKTIARQLGVAAILEGSVQKAGNAVLINVQLIDARNDNHLWAESYQRTLDNIFGVEGEVAGKIAAALKATLSPSQSQAVVAVPTRNPQAYDAYLRAKHAQDIDNRHFDGSPEAIAGYQQAVALDPQFALAWADLAWAQLWAWRDEIQPATFGQSATLRMAQENATHALTLQPDLPEAHLAMSVIDLYGLHDVDGARTHAQRALELRPNDAYAYRLLADVDQNQGNFVAGARQMEQALALKPNDGTLARLVAMARAAIGDYAGHARPCVGHCRSARMTLGRTPC
jgi:TolB-like protein